MTTDRRPGVIKGYCNRCGAGRPPRGWHGPRPWKGAVVVLFCRTHVAYFCRACWRVHTLEQHPQPPPEEAEVQQQPGQAQFTGRGFRKEIP